jgi:hypothetical protein
MQLIALLLLLLLPSAAGFFRGLSHQTVAV